MLVCDCFLLSFFIFFVVNVCVVISFILFFVGLIIFRFNIDLLFRLRIDGVVLLIKLLCIMFILDFGWVIGCILLYVWVFGLVGFREEIVWLFCLGFLKEFCLFLVEFRFLFIIFSLWLFKNFFCICVVVFIVFCFEECFLRVFFKVG